MELSHYRAATILARQFLVVYSTVCLAKPTQSSTGWAVYPISNFSNQLHRSAPAFFAGHLSNVKGPARQKWNEAPFIIAVATSNVVINLSKLVDLLIRADVNQSQVFQTPYTWTGGNYTNS